MASIVLRSRPSEKFGTDSSGSATRLLYEQFDASPLVVSLARFAPARPRGLLPQPVRPALDLGVRDAGVEDPAPAVEGGVEVRIAPQVPVQGVQHRGRGRADHLPASIAPPRMLVGKPAQRTLLALQQTRGIRIDSRQAQLRAVASHLFRQPLQPVEMVHIVVSRLLRQSQLGQPPEQFAECHLQLDPRQRQKPAAPATMIRRGRSSAAEPFPSPALMVGLWSDRQDGGTRASAGAYSR